jgi:hypothetical protein
MEKEATEQRKEFLKLRMEEGTINDTEKAEYRVLTWSSRPKASQ